MNPSVLVSKYLTPTASFLPSTSTDIALVALLIISNFHDCRSLSHPNFSPNILLLLAHACVCTYTHILSCFMFCHQPFSSRTVLMTLLWGQWFSQGSSWFDPCLSALGWACHKTWKTGLLSLFYENFILSWEPKVRMVTLTENNQSN